MKYGIPMGWDMVDFNTYIPIKFCHTEYKQGTDRVVAQTNECYLLCRNVYIDQDYIQQHFNNTEFDLAISLSVGIVSDGLKVIDISHLRTYTYFVFGSVMFDDRLCYSTMLLPIPDQWHNFHINNPKDDYTQGHWDWWWKSESNKKVTVSLDIGKVYDSVNDKTYQTTLGWRRPRSV